MMVKKRAKGISLLEIIIAMFLVAIAFATLAAIFPLAYRHASMSKNRILATSTARNVIETLRAVPWGRATPDFVKQDQGYMMVIDGKRQPVVFEVKEIKFDPANSTGNGPDPESTVCEVYVTVEWKEGTGPSSQMVTKELTYSGVLTH